MSFHIRGFFFFFPIYFEIKLFIKMWSGLFSMGGCPQSLVIKTTPTSVNFETVEKYMGEQIFESNILSQFKISICNNV